MSSSIGKSACRNKYRRLVVTLFARESKRAIPKGSKARRSNLRARDLCFFFFISIRPVQLSAAYSEKRHETARRRKCREREREREKERGRGWRKDREEKQIRARAEESVMYEGTVSMRVCSCSREHVAPISARRVSGSRGHRPFLASPLSLSLSLSLAHRCASQIARLHTILLSAASSSSLFPETSHSPARHPASFYLAPRMHPCTETRALLHALARLQRRRNTICPARKWRNYIRGREQEEGHKSAR